MNENPLRDLIISTLLRFGLTALLCALPFMKFGWSPASAGFALLIFAPCSFMLPTPIMAWAEIVARLISQQPLAKWQGNYYEFAGTHIRVYPVGNEDNSALWFVDIDVLKVIGQKPTLMLESTFRAHEYGPILGTRQHGFSEEGIEKLLRANDHCESMRLLMWIQREVVKPHRRRLAIASSG